MSLSVYLSICTGHSVDEVITGLIIRLHYVEGIASTINTSKIDMLHFIVVLSTCKVYNTIYLKICLQSGRIDASESCFVGSRSNENNFCVKPQHKTTVGRIVVYLTRQRIWVRLHVIVSCYDCTQLLPLLLELILPTATLETRS